MSDNLQTYAPHIPDAVRRASMRADELAREAGVANVPPLDDQPEPPAPDDDTTTVVNPPNGAGDGQQLTLPEIEPPPVSTPQQSDWEQRYNTLQGKYNSEIPELRGQLRAMQDMVNNMQAQPRAPEPRTSEQTFQTLPPRSVPQEDLDAYGPDLVGASQRWSKLAVEPEIAELKQRISQLEGGVQQQAHMTTAQRTEANMDRMMPEWRNVNVDRGFIEWLHQVDPFSGRTRQNLIDEAYNTGDANRTIAFFQAYANEHTTVSPTSGTQPFQTGTPPADRLPLADLAVPGRGQVASPPTPGAPTRRIWTNADIAAFNRQKQRGQWIGREREAAEIEADYMRAPAEGRFRQ